ncbi:unnamed protein product [Adineta ricciae]|uniref:G-protein coupled receptors family 1 profile domain-containing protein n=1 Tax=Adineta ricciae TaxID=249248 RepID=A0A815RMQ3_ADIRI|nr:unnamed protein product [Adineta ricciae]CAF1479329.1 unnamed protein product [Adineta ricciae]
MKNKTCFGINIISLTITIFGTIIALIVLICILLQRKTLYNIQLLLCANNYLLLFILGILTLTINIRIYHGDSKEVNNEKETLSCRMNSYIFYVFMSAVYLAFILQATFRLCRLIYVSRQNLLNFRTYWLIIPLFWLFSFLLNLPLLLWHGQELIPGENACLVPKDDPRSIYGLPTAIMLLILAFTNELVICFYRILILSVSVCVLTLSLALTYITPQIHLCHKKPRVIPMIKDQKDIPQ